MKYVPRTIVLAFAAPIPTGSDLVPPHADHAFRT